MVNCTQFYCTGRTGSRVPMASTMELYKLSCTSWYNDNRPSVAANVLAVVSVHGKFAYIFRHKYINYHVRRKPDGKKCVTSVNFVSQIITHKNKTIANNLVVAHGELSIPDSRVDQPTEHIPDGLCDVVLRRTRSRAHFLQFAFANSDLVMQ